MLKDVFPLKTVGDFLNNKFICIKIDAEKGEGKELAKRYNVKYYPTFIAIDVNENIVMTKTGSSSPEDFISFIDRSLDSEKTPERLRQRYESGERSADLISAYAGLKMYEVRSKRHGDKEKEKEAFDMVRDYFHGLKDSERLAPENLFIYTGYTEDITEDIARYMIDHLNDFAPSIKGDIRKRAEMLAKMQIYNYVTGETPYDKASYLMTKKVAVNLGLNKDGQYNIPFKLIEEARSTGDLNKFLKICEKDYKYLSKELQATLMCRFSTVMNTYDKEILKRASKFIRSQLAEMDASLLTWVGMELVKIENGNKDAH